MILIKKTLALLTCLGMLLPGAAQATCLCCAQGGCAGTDQSCSAEVCPSTKATSTNSCCGKSNNCCSEAKTASCCEDVITACSSPAGKCGPACTCCPESPPVVPARCCVPLELQEQLSGLAWTPGAAPAELDGHQITQLVASGSLTSNSNLRLHALLGVWLN